MFVVIHIRLPRLQLRTSDARLINSRRCVTIKSHAVAVLSPRASMSVEGLSSVCSQELQETIVSNLNHEQSTKTFLSPHSLASKNLKSCVPFRSYENDDSYQLRFPSRSPDLSAEMPPIYYIYKLNRTVIKTSRDR